MVADSVAFLKAAGREVFVDAEHFFDGFAEDWDYALAVVRTAAEAGADGVDLCDTKGGTLTAMLAAAVRRAMEVVTCQVGIHTHNDCELAVANAIAAVEAGATQVPGHDQRLRRASRQRQPLLDHPAAGGEARPALPAAGQARSPDRGVPLRRGGGQCTP
jgi:hypothetical protein